MNRAKALLVGDVSMVRALGRAEIPVVLASTEPSPPAARSRFCSEVLRVSDGDGAIDDIVAWARRQSQRPVLFYQGDGDLLMMARNQDRLREHAHLVIARASLVEDLVDKLRFAELAVRVALPVPKTLSLRCDADNSEALGAWSMFPCVLKPSVRSNWIGSALQRENGGAGKAVRIDAREALLGVERLMRADGVDCVLQAAISGGEERILSYHAYVREDGSVAAEFTGKKVRTRPRQYGYSTCVTISHDDEVQALGRAIVKSLGFTGVLKMDFKRGENDGALHLLEINPRFNLWHHLGAVAGVSIPALVYADCVAPGTARSPQTARPSAVWMSTRGDLRAMLEYRRAGELSLRAWLRQAALADVHEDLDWRDPAPFVADLAQRARRALPLVLRAAGVRR